MVKVLLGFVALSAIAIPGTIYVAKPELFGSNKEAITEDSKKSNKENGGNTSDPKNANEQTRNDSQNNQGTDASIPSTGGDQTGNSSPASA